MSDFCEMAENVRRVSLPRNPVLAAAAVMDSFCATLECRAPLDMRSRTEQQRQKMGPDTVNGQPMEWK